MFIGQKTTCVYEKKEEKLFLSLFQYPLSLEGFLGNAFVSYPSIANTTISKDIDALLIVWHEN